MEDIMGFLLDNYIYILFVAIFLILALIGYLVDSNRNNSSKKVVTKEEKPSSTVEVMQGAKINTAIDSGNKEEVKTSNTSK